MKSLPVKSSLESLPDEILLDICKYLSICDILQSFVGLNIRMTRMISYYRYHVSFYKTSFSQFNYLCRYIIPCIGSQIRSLIIDSNYSLLQDEVFMNYFRYKMSIIFPRLEIVTLSTMTYNGLMAIFSSLHDLPYLIEVRICDSLPIDKTQQILFTQTLFQLNAHRLKRIIIDDQSSSVTFDNTNVFSNIQEVCLNITLFNELPSLFNALPNVRKLSVVIENSDKHFPGIIYEMKFSPLIQLKSFHLTSTYRRWTLEELNLVLIYLPNLQNLSLFLSTNDIRLITGDTLLSSFGQRILQFHYAAYFFPNDFIDDIKHILVTWPPSNPVKCFYSSKYLLIHTLPLMFRNLQHFFLFNEMNSFGENENTINDEQILNNLCLCINNSLTYSKALTIISKYKNIEKLSVFVQENHVLDEDLQIFSHLKLRKLFQLSFHGSIPADIRFLSSIIDVATNLFRLDLSFEHLLQIFQHQHVCKILGRRLTSLCIMENSRDSLSETFNSHHVPLIVSIFYRLRDIYIDLSHLKSSWTGVPMLPNGMNLSSLSCESMVLYILLEFQKLQINGLCIEAHFIDEIMIDAAKWLRNNSILGQQQFYANFHLNPDRLIIWMG